MILKTLKLKINNLCIDPRAQPNDEVYDVIPATT